MEIILIDDDVSLCRSLKTYLEKTGFAVDVAHTGANGLEFLAQKKYDAMILDYMLPDGMDGLMVCKEVKSRYAELPILMLSARGNANDKIIGLDVGADDYLAKPFEPLELVARLKALVRRPGYALQQQSNAQIEKFEDLEIDTYAKRARLENSDMNLTTAEFALLETMAKAPGKPFNRDELSRALRGFDWDATDRTLDILVSKLRQKLKDDLKNPRFIKTVWGSGYMFIGRRAA